MAMCRKCGADITWSVHQDTGATMAVDSVGSIGRGEHRFVVDFDVMHGSLPTARPVSAKADTFAHPAHEFVCGESRG